MTAAARPSGSTDRGVDDVQSRRRQRPEAHPPAADPRAGQRQGDGPPARSRGAAPVHARLRRHGADERGGHADAGERAGGDKAVGVGCGVTLW